MGKSKKPRRQRAVITITENPDGTIKSELNFDVSIKGKDKGGVEYLALAAGEFIQQSLAKAIEMGAIQDGKILRPDTRIVLPWPCAGTN